MSPKSSLKDDFEQKGSQKNVSLATTLVHSNQGNFHAKGHSAPEDQQNEPKIKSQIPSLDGLPPTFLPTASLMQRQHVYFSPNL